MKPYILSADARRDLIEIWDYIARDSIDAADRVAADLCSAIQRLATMPGIGHRRDDLSDESLRFYRMYSYLILYQPESSPLSIVRVLHAAQDVKAILESQ